METKKKKKPVKMIRKQSDYIKQRAYIRNIVKKNFIINLCPKCSDTKFTIIAFNSQSTSVNLQCNMCNKKIWEKLINDFDQKGVKELNPLFKKFDAVNKNRRQRNSEGYKFEPLRLIKITSNAQKIIKNTKSERHITQEIQDKVWNRDGGKCVQCGSNENLEFDHIIPHSKGGANTYRNIQLLCEPCNRSKSNKIG